MARRSERLGVVLMVAERHEREAAAHLSQYQQYCRQQARQLEQLREYQRQYLGDYGSRQGQISPQQMRRYSDFLQRLGGAISEQAEAVKTLQGQLEQVRAHWQKCHRERKAVEELIERLRAAETAEEEKRLQKELDELAGQMRGFRGFG